MQIPSSLVDAFARDGHVVVREIASRDEIAGYRPVLEQVVREMGQQNETQGRIDDYSRLFTQVTNVWRLSDAARAIVFTRKYAAVAAQLLGTPSVRLYHDQALFKPAGAARTPWHQDRFYWPLDTEQTLTMWLPLQDVGDDIGPMIFASGSNRDKDLGDLSISEETDRRLAELIATRGWPVVSNPINSGDATFHAGSTIHSAGANQTSRTREVLTVIYYAAGARAATPANENQRVDLEVFLPGVRPGEEAKSELNPVLYP